MNSGESQGRFANETFKTFEVTGEAIVLSPEMSDADFELSKDFAFSVIETRELEGSETAFLGFLVPVIYKGIEIIGIGLLGAAILDRVNNIQQLLNDESANILWIPNNDELFDDNNLEGFPLPGFEEVSTGTPPFDVGNVIGFDDNVFFPKGDGFLEDIVSGQFEFPLDDEQKIYFLAAGKSGNNLGDLREQAVADLVGGTLAKDSNGQDVTVFEPGASASVPVDVFGANGELILVGGPKKATKLSRLGQILSDLKIVAQARGVKAQHYFSDNTPESVIKFTEKRLGAENVFTFPEVTLPQ